MALSYNCEFDKAIFHMQRTLDISIAAKILWGIAITKGNLAYFCYFYPGRINLGYQISAEALRAAEESGDIMSKGYTYSSHGIFCYARGLFEEAERHLLKGIEFCERINEKGWKAIAHLFLGETYFAIGNFPSAKDHYEKVCELLKHTRLMPSSMSFARTGVAKSRVVNNEKDVDLESLYIQSRNNKIKTGEGWISKNIGEILLYIDDQHMSESENWIQKAIEADQRNRMMFYLGKDYALYAELFKRKGDGLRAQENFGKAIEILKECGADGWVEKYEKELATLL
jgi:tetratricopeptide (TPR) repeat protein